MKGLLFTYALTYGGAVFSIFDPFKGLLIYVAFSIIKPQEMWFWSVPAANYSRIVAIALLIGWLLKSFGNWQFGRAKPVVVAIVVFWLWSAVGIAVAVDKDRAVNFVEDISKIILPFLVGITTIDSLEKVKQLAWVIVLSEGYLAYEFNLSYFGGYNRLALQEFAAMDNNSHAIALVTCVGLAFFMGLHSPALWKKPIAFAAAALMVHATLFSFSRGGMLALIASAVVSFLLVPKQPKHFIFFALGIVIAWQLAGQEVTERFVSSFANEKQRDGSAQSRIQLWSACWQLMLERPLGVGPDNFGAVVEEFGFPKGKEAHSLWMQVGAEQGIFGLGCLLLFHGTVVARLWPLTRERHPVPDPSFRHLARMVIAALIGFAIAAQFVSLKLLEVPYYVALIGAGTLKLLPPPPPQPQAMTYWSAAQPGAPS